MDRRVVFVRRNRCHERCTAVSWVQRSQISMWLRHMVKRALQRRGRALPKMDSFWVWIDGGDTSVHRCDNCMHLTLLDCLLYLALLSSLAMLSYTGSSFFKLHPFLFVHRIWWENLETYSGWTIIQRLHARLLSHTWYIRRRNRRCIVHAGLQIGPFWWAVLRKHRGWRWAQ